MYGLVKLDLLHSAKKDGKEANDVDGREESVSTRQQFESTSDKRTNAEVFSLHHVHLMSSVRIKFLRNVIIYFLNCKWHSQYMTFVKLIYIPTQYKV